MGEANDAGRETNGVRREEGSMTEIDDFKGRSALVTGAADGIGAALSEALIRAGARVFASDIDEDKLKATATRIGAGYARCDVSDEGAVVQLVDQAWSEIGPIDLLCANAGVIVPGSILDVSRADAEYIFGVNVWGIVNACKPFARKLRESGRGGNILLTGSEHSLSNPSYLRAAPLHLYNMTKHAVLSIGESLRAELGPEGVGISVLCPGPVESGLTANSEKQRPAQFGRQADVDFSKVDPSAIENLGSLYMSAERAAEIALAGIRAGVFIIPTHAFEKDDVDARYAETIAGFELLE
jgi:NAD(P)-dependent dehydrogenase (short-subunit alcohol dehydrogenase family)